MEVHRNWVRSIMSEIPLLQKENGDKEKKSFFKAVKKLLAAEYAILWPGRHLPSWSQCSQIYTEGPVSPRNPCLHKVIQDGINKALWQQARAWARSCLQNLLLENKSWALIRQKDLCLSSGLRILSWKWDPGLALGFLTIPVLWGSVLGMADVRTKPRTDRLVLLCSYAEKAHSRLMLCWKGFQRCAWAQCPELWLWWTLISELITRAEKWGMLDSWPWICWTWAKASLLS